MIGECGLCNAARAELQDSHVFPKWTYRHLRDRTSRKPDPFLIRGHKAFQSSRQQKGYLLCSACEQLLAKREKYVSEFANHPEKGFPFIARITGRRGFVASDAELMDLDGVDREMFGYFALAVLWRYDVMLGGSQNLGPYCESIRRYLVGGGCPQGVYVVVGFLSARQQTINVDLTMTSPMVERVDGYRLHRFLVCGFEFHVAVGSEVPEWITEACWLREPGAPVLRLTSKSSRSAQALLRAMGDVLISTEKKDR